MKNIFITGGAGYIGSHCVVSLIKNGYNPIILDNFSNSKLSALNKLKAITNKKIKFYKIDLKNEKKLKLIFKKHKCYAVIHCAGFKSPSESIKKTIDYYNNNIGSTLTLINCMRENKIFKIIFSSSASVYDDYQKLPLTENSKIGNTKNPYATTKYIVERILTDISNFDKRWSVRIARYFNPISNHSSGVIKEDPKGVSANLIPCIIKVGQKKTKILKIYGKNYKTKDGTGIRDYIHVVDLAEGHVAMLKNNRMKPGLKIYNFGTGKGRSVLEVLKEFKLQTGLYIPFKFFNKRKGDISKSYCSPKKAYKELRWKAKYNLKKAMLDINETL